MASKVGYRVYDNPPQPQEELLAALFEADVAHLTDAMNKFGVVDSRIQPVYRPIERAVGAALTVKVHPGDHLMVRKAMGMATAGQIMVIDSRADTTKAVWGGMVSEMMARRDLGGLVIDGAARDARHIGETGLPVWARSVVATAPTFSGPGEVNTPVACGGVPVLPGDIVVADAEGIVVIPRQDLETVVDTLDQVVAKEERWMEQIEAGQLLKIDDVNETLAGDGVTEHGPWKRP